MKCSLWLGQGWQKLDPQSRGLHHGCLASEVGCPLSRGDRKTQYPACRGTSPMQAPDMCAVPSHSALLPWLFFLLLSLSPNSSPEPLTSLWHFASVHLPGSSIPLFFPSVPDLCAPSPKAVTLRDSV